MTSDLPGDDDPLAERQPDSGTRPLLERLGPTAWRIVDVSDVPDEDGDVVALIEEVDESGVSVTWLHPLPLASRFLSAEMALIDLELWRRRGSPAERPEPIPHHPPTGPHRTI